ncbi:alpha/beta hydrolase [Aphanothece sacrum]|uniref:alpha/beta hydrolase n=1 Tax=Aphanothece sacrum TaxID=1122 RepID=UPI000F615641
MRQNLNFSLSLTLICGIFANFSWVIPVQAAEQVILTYSILRESVSVDELSDLAKTGSVSPALKSYLKLANKNPEDLRNVLNQSVNVDPVILSKVLNSFAGNYVLDEVGQIIHTPSKRASRESLRGALVTSAVSDRNIQVVEILENYPTSELHVDGDRLAEIYKQIQGVVNQIPRLPF